MLWLKANWGWLWKLAAAIAAVCLVWWAISTVLGWRDDSRKLVKVEEALKLEVDCAKGTKCAERAAAEIIRQAAITEKTISGYEKEIADIRSRPIPTRVIRVCRSPGTGAVHLSPNPGESAGTDAAGVVSGTDEFDTRPLRELARRADEINGGYRWLRNRDDALAVKP